MNRYVGKKHGGWVDGRHVVGGHLVVRRAAARRWTAELPAELGGANVLNVSMTWRNPHDGRGDANFWTGIRPDCTQPAP